MSVRLRTILLATVVTLLIPTAAQAKLGIFDPSYGDGGTATVPVNGSFFEAIAVDAEGRTLVLTRTQISDQAPHVRVHLVRFDADGTPSSDFGTDGVVEVTLGDASQLSGNFHLFVRSDGTIAVTGVFWNYQAPGGGSAVALFDAHGQPVADFGDQGVLRTDDTSTDRSIPNYVAMDGSDRLYATTDDSDGHTAVERLEPDGSLDSTYGDFAAWTYHGHPPAPDGSAILAVSPAGNLFLSLELGRPDCFSCGSWVYALRSNGRTNKAFGDEGFVFAGHRTDVGYVVGGAVTSSGKLLLMSQKGADGEYLSRFLKNGDVDIPFGSEGWMHVPAYLGDQIQQERVERVAFVLAGAKTYLLGARFARLKADGSLDLSFGHHGYADAPAGVSSIRVMAAGPGTALSLGIWLDPRTPAVARLLT